mgnify:FL=1
MKDQNTERLSKIFGPDFDPAYFGRICEVFAGVLEKYVLPERNISELLFMNSFLQSNWGMYIAVALIKNFEMLVLKLLSKKEREKVSRFILDIEHIYELLKEEVGVSKE